MLLVALGIWLNIYICSAQSKNRYNSRIVLRKVGILTLLRHLGILTFRNTILELLLRKVRVGTKWELHFIFIFLCIVQSENLNKVGLYCMASYGVLFQISFCIKHMIIENSLIKYVFNLIMAVIRFSINVKQRNTEYHQF